MALYCNCSNGLLSNELKYKEDLSEIVHFKSNVSYSQVKINKNFSVKL